MRGLCSENAQEQLVCCAIGEELCSENAQEQLVCYAIGEEEVYKYQFCFCCNCMLHPCIQCL